MRLCRVTRQQAGGLLFSTVLHETTCTTKVSVHAHSRHVPGGRCVSGFEPLPLGAAFFSPPSIANSVRVSHRKRGDEGKRTYPDSQQHKSSGGGRFGNPAVVSLEGGWGR